MANTLSFTPLSTLNTSAIPGGLIGNSGVIRVISVNDGFSKFNSSRFQSLETKAIGSNTPATKPNSIVCADCDGNGAVACGQCKGGGVNTQDHFNGQFKAGALCWLCRGKREVLCGNCNGAGFCGGFMSTQDE
ncbi:hypothetical protein RND81_07G108000 [Saponaria officinalis]|uniref:BSD2 cysteine rich domain-containing protein n=1 Tax=Saponaria officinalis TaxID=3572 RepID=A0AAW1JPK2_SAPOF